MIWRCFEIYTKNSESIYGIKKFYDAVSIAYYIKCLENKKKPKHEFILSRSFLIKQWRKAEGNKKSILWLKIQSQISKDEILLHRFLEHLDKTIVYDPKDYDFVDVAHTYKKGCFGVVVE